MDLAAALSPATPSQLSRSVSAAGGCESCSLPLLRWAMVPLSETLRLDNKEGLEEAARASSSLFSKHTGGGRDLPARRGRIPITSKPSTVLQWTPSSFLCRGPKASKVKKLFPAFVLKPWHDVTSITEVQTRTRQQPALHPAAQHAVRYPADVWLKNPRISLLKRCIKSLSLKMVFSNAWAALGRRKSYPGS